ncbi:MAG: hypothetical protein IK104_08265 [Clostridia bacterium]|nr:hypothetical protein [Clostridia bacterium]
MKIVYKVVVPLIVVASLLLMVFLPILHVKLEGTLLSMVNLSIPEYNSVAGTIEEYRQMDASRKETLKSVLDMLFSGEETETSQKIKEEFKTPLAWLITTGVLLAIMVLLLIAVIVMAIATKKYGITFLLSLLALAAGFGADQMLKACVKALQRMNLSSLISAFAGSLGDLISGLGDALGGLLSGLVNNAFKITALEFAYGYQLGLLVLFGLAVFTGGWFIKRRYV